MSTELGGKFGPLRTFSLLHCRGYDFVETQTDLPRDEEDDDPLQRVRFAVLEDVQKESHVVLHESNRHKPFARHVQHPPTTMR